MNNIISKIELDIKKYVRSLNKPENIIYQENKLLIMSCFSKALEIIEENQIQYHETINKQTRAGKGITD